MRENKEQDDLQRYYSDRQNYGGSASGQNSSSYSGYQNRSDRHYDAYEEEQQDMGIGWWLLTFLISIIPVVNIVMLIIWAAGSNPKNTVRKNWARAKLIWAVIMTVLSVLLWIMVWQIGYAVIDSVVSDSDTRQEIENLLDGNYDNDAVPLPDLTEERAVVDGTGTEGEWEDMMFEFDGHTYTLPMTYGELEANGWTLDEDDYDPETGYVLNPKDTSASSYMLNNPAYPDVVVMVGFYNPDDSVKDITECEIYRFYYDTDYAYDQTHDFPGMSLHGGPAIGMDKDTVLSYMGKCEDVYKSDGYSSYYYNNDDYSKNVEFDLYKKYGITSINLIVYPNE